MYNIQISSTSSFTNIFLDINVSNLIHIYKGDINWNDTYYWRVRPLYGSNDDDYIYGDWMSYDHYQKYLDWRMNDDESKMAQKVMELCVGGQEGLIPLFPNSDYASFNRQ